MRRTLAGRAMTAALAVLAVAVLPLAGTATAAGGNGLPGTVTQVGGPQTVHYGGDGEYDAAQLDYDATLPATVTGDVTARLVFPGDQFGLWTAAQVAGMLSSSCIVDDGDFQRCPWSVPGAGEADAGDVVLDLPDAPAATSIAYNAETSVFGGRALPRDLVLRGSVELRSGADGSLLATGPTQLAYDFVESPEAFPALYGRDASGVLWKYDGTGDLSRPFARRTKVGGGWNAYTAITALGDLTAQGRGDLVARDKDGALWYYQGTYDPARPFAERVKVGGGWNVYTALAAGGLSPTTGLPTLVGRDAAGKLWLYETLARGTFTPRVEAGHGWNVYSPLVRFAAGLAGRDSSGVLWTYDIKDGTGPTTPYGPRQRVGGGWQIYTALAGIKDADLDLTGDLVARDASGRLWLYLSTAHPDRPAHRTLVGSGWNTYTLLF